MKIIARIHNAYDEKFGVPRQSGLAEEVISTVVFEEEFRVAEALRGIEEFSHLWLIWAFDRAERDTWSPTVRPPRLGGNKRVGVFATRSPFRPNAIGLSCVRLLGVEKTPEGNVLKVAGADLVNGTPIYDVKPYIRTIMERKQIGEEQAKKLIREVDKDRSSYYRYYTDQVWGEASNYDLVIDVSKVGHAGAAKVVKCCLEAMKKD